MDVLQRNREAIEVCTRMTFRLFQSHSDGAVLVTCMDPARVNLCIHQLDQSWGIFLEIDRPTVCVSHGGVIRSLFRLVGDTPKEEAAEIAIPQDRILRVERDRRIIEWI